MTFLPWSDLLWIACSFMNRFVFHFKMFHVQVEVIFSGNSVRTLKNVNCFAMKHFYIPVNTSNNYICESNQSVFFTSIGSFDHRDDWLSNTSFDWWPNFFEKLKHKEACRQTKKRKAILWDFLQNKKFKIKFRFELMWFCFWVSSLNIVCVWVSILCFDRCFICININNWCIYA